MQLVQIVQQQKDVGLQRGLSEAELQQFQATLPGDLPPEIADLLRFARGFDVPHGDPVEFTGQSEPFLFETLIPFPVAVSKTQTGDVWVVDVASDGRWGSVFHVSHDPPVFVMTFDTFGEFIESAAHPDRLHDIAEALVRGIWNGRSANRGLAVSDARRSGDPALAAFAASLSGDHVIFDWRKPTGDRGFVWEIDASLRYRRAGDSLIFAITTA